MYSKSLYPAALDLCGFKKYPRFECALYGFLALSDPLYYTVLYLCTYVVRFYIVQCLFGCFFAQFKDLL